MVIGCRAGTQKLKNIDRNPKVSLMIESGSTREDLRGLIIQGDARYTTDPAEMLELTRHAARARGVADDQLPTQPPAGAAYIRVTPRKYISWDRTKD